MCVCEAKPAGGGDGEMREGGAISGEFPKADQGKYGMERISEKEGLGLRGEMAGWRRQRDGSLLARRPVTDGAWESLVGAWESPAPGTPF